MPVNGLLISTHISASNWALIPWSVYYFDISHIRLDTTAQCDNLIMLMSGNQPLEGAAMENRWIVYTEDGTEVCDCDSRLEAYAQMDARGARFPGTYSLTENSFSEVAGIGHLTQIASETFTL